MDTVDKIQRRYVTITDRRAEALDSGSCRLRFQLNPQPGEAWIKAFRDLDYDHTYARLEDYEFVGKEARIIISGTAIDNVLDDFPRLVKMANQTVVESTVEQEVERSIEQQEAELRTKEREQRQQEYDAKVKDWLEENKKRA